MLRDFLVCIIACLVTARAFPTGNDDQEPEPPRSPVGPFDVFPDPSISPPPNDTAYEGDIKVPGLQIGTAGSLKPWPNAIIPYTFHCSIENQPNVMKVVYEAMKEWQNRTCLQFVEKKPEDVAYVEFIKLNGCWATRVGYAKAKTQISIGRGCDYKHVMVHELGHVIGFWHEQSRGDRDNYIKINYDNIYPSLAYNFDKVPKEDHRHFGVSYDFGSIMHYPYTAFARQRGLQTIEPIRTPDAVPYVKLSDKDAEQTRIMYGCDASTNHAPQATDCVDRLDACKSWVNYCSINVAVRETYCPNTCKSCPTDIKEPTTMPTTVTTPQTSTTPRILPARRYTGVRCVDRSTRCAGWLEGGRCETDVWVQQNCLLSCGRYDICDKEPVQLQGECLSPFKISAYHNEDTSGFSDDRFTASSEFTPGGGWVARPHAARLYLTDNHQKREIGAWCANPGDENPSLVIAFPQTRTVRAVATQGRDGYFEHVETYSLSFMDNGGYWQQYKENGKKKTFNGNCDNVTPVANLLKNPVTTKHIRFEPIKSVGVACLRVEIYGC